MALFLIAGLIIGFTASYAIYQPQIQNLQNQIESLESQILNLQAENTKIKTQIAEYQTLKEMLREYNQLIKNPSITEYVIYRHFSIKYGEETTKKFWEIIVGHKGVELEGFEGRIGPPPQPQNLQSQLSDLKAENLSLKEENQKLKEAVKMLQPKWVRPPKAWTYDIPLTSRYYELRDKGLSKAEILEQLIEEFKDEMPIETIKSWWEVIGKNLP